MSEKQLLLPSAKIAVPVRSRTFGERVLFVVGVFVVLYGLVNVLFRLSQYVDASAIETAFTPLGALALQSDSVPTSPSASRDPDQSVGATIFATTVATTTPLIPARLAVPSIGVNATVEQVGKKADGSMATPSSFTTTGWYKLGAKPGELGNAVIAGHVNNALTKSGVFEHLSEVTVGDKITVSDASGRTLTYTVYETHQYHTDTAPAAEIFTAQGPSQLVLITCDGAWDPVARSYDKRFVVYARLTSY